MTDKTENDRFEAWRPNDLVSPCHGKSDYHGTPYARFRPAHGYAQVLAMDSARYVNRKIRAIMQRTRKS